MNDNIEYAKISLAKYDEFKVTIEKLKTSVEASRERTEYTRVIFIEVLLDVFIVFSKFNTTGFTGQTLLGQQTGDFLAAYNNSSDRKFTIEIKKNEKYILKIYRRGSDKEVIQ